MKQTTKEINANEHSCRENCSKLKRKPISAQLCKYVAVNLSKVIILPPYLSEHGVMEEIWYFIM